MLWELIAVGAVLCAGATIVVSTVYTGVAPMPTLRAARGALLDSLPTQLPILSTSPGIIVELGAGWGSLAMPLARRFPQTVVISYELSPLPWAVCRLRGLLAGRNNLETRWSDFHRADLRDAVLVVCYLHPQAMTRLRAKLEAELPAGAWVISHTFALPGWTPIRTRLAPDLHASPIYVYRWPNHARG